MDCEQVIALAREAAFHTLVQYDELFRFAELIAKHEREECAKVCEVSVKRPAGYGGCWEGYGESVGEKTGTECAAAIRSRNNGS